MNIDEKIAEYKADIKKYECVYKASAIGSIREMAKEKAEDCRQMVEWLEELKQLREQASSSEKPNKWIPATTLPEKDGKYLLFGKIDEDEDDYIFIGEYDSCAEQFGVWQEQFDRSTLGCLGSEFFEYASVLAWMPLPTSYRGESEE